MPRLLHRMLALFRLPGQWASWLVLPLVASVLLSVIAAQYGWTTLLDWNGRLPILGQALTVNSLIDLQWYIFAIIVLFGGVWALLDDNHVSVDFLSLQMSPRRKLWIRMLGDMVFLVPFCAIIAWYGWSFAETAWRTSEGSAQGGLDGRWLIKAALPVAFGFLGLLGALRALGTAIQLARRADDAPDGPDHPPLNEAR
ncbi:MAG: TRAP transporter small permease subunit [Paracoccaceae bacterium]